MKLSLRDAVATGARVKLALTQGQQMAEERQDEQYLQVLGVLSQLHGQEQQQRQQEMAGLPDERALQYIPPEQRGEAYNQLLQQRQQVTQRPYRYGPEAQAQLPAVTPQAKRMQGVARLGAQAAAPQPPTGNAATSGEGGGIAIGGRQFPVYNPEEDQQRIGDLEFAESSRQALLQTERDPTVRARLEAELTAISAAKAARKPLSEVKGSDGLPLSRHPGLPSVDKKDYADTNKRIADVMKAAGGLKSDEAKQQWAIFYRSNPAPVDLSTQAALDKAKLWAHEAAFALSQTESLDQQKVSDKALDGLRRQATDLSELAQRATTPTKFVMAARQHDELVARHPDLGIRPLLEGRYSDRQKVQRRVSAGVTGTLAPGTRPDASLLPEEQFEMREEDETDDERLARHLEIAADAVYQDDPVKRRQALTEAIGGLTRFLQSDARGSVDQAARDTAVERIGELWEKAGFPGKHPLAGAKLSGLTESQRAAVDHQTKMRGFRDRELIETKRAHEALERHRGQGTKATQREARARLEGLIRIYNSGLKAFPKDFLSPSDEAAKIDLEARRDEALLQLELLNEEEALAAPADTEAPPAGGAALSGGAIRAAWAAINGARGRSPDEIKKAKARFLKAHPGFKP